MPKACPECKTRMKKGIKSTIVPLVLARTPRKYSFSTELDMEQDIPILTRTKKENVEEAYQLLRETYEDKEAAEEVIRRVKENKAEYAKEKNAELP